MVLPFLQMARPAASAPPPSGNAPEPEIDSNATDVNSVAPSASNGLHEGHGPSLPPAELVSGTNRRLSPERIREAEEDRVLIAEAQQGSHAAFRRLVERNQRRAYVIAFGLVRNEQDARELVQDAFLRVFKSIGNFQGGSSFFTWLYRIITNLSIDLIRKPGRRAAELDENRRELDESDDADFPLLSRLEGADPSDGVRRSEIAARLQVALDALPEYHRTVILLREVEGMSYDELATAMQVSKGTIMSRLFHARQKLQRALAECYEEQYGHRPNTSSAQKNEERS